MEWFNLDPRTSRHSEEHDDLSGACVLTDGTDTLRTVATAHSGRHGGGGGCDIALYCYYMVLIRADGVG